MDDLERGILAANVHEIPFAVIDLETTGLNAGHDRVVEISVYRVEPGKDPTVVLDTLVNPCRPVRATEIHGITDEDVIDAPTFDEIAGDLVRAVSDCVVAAYNVYFDMRFLEMELRKTRIDAVPPHLCVMYLRPMLGLGNRCPLPEACSCHGVHYSDERGHTASADAQAAAGLLGFYLDQMNQKGVATFADLARLSDYKFVSSFDFAPLSISQAAGLSPCVRPKPRQRVGPRVLARPPREAPATTQLPTRNALVEYAEAMKIAISDLRITPEEVAVLEKIRLEGLLSWKQVRMLHARFFSAVISAFVEDGEMDAQEANTLHLAWKALKDLGWAPGDPVAQDSPAPELAGLPDVAAGPQPLAGKTIVVTGTLEHYSRSQIEGLIKTLGGRSASSVSKKTDFVLVGADPGSKADKARSLGVKILSEDEFRKLVGEA